MTSQHAGQRSGQTLLESLVAIGIISIGIVSLITLLVSLRNTANTTMNQSLATQLAQEALEGVHYIRDSNWLRQEAGDSVNYYDGLRNGTDYGGIYIWDPADTDPNTAIGIGILATGSITSSSQAIVYQNSSQYYVQTSASTVPTDWTATKFRRWVTAYPLCRDTATPTTTTEQFLTSNGTDCSSLGSTYSEVGLHVTVIVTWPEPGRTANYTLEENLYNWKYAGT